ncbi:LOW QUALITY PROTEIN: mitochondrial import receptor subunit TOM9-2 [Elaeis guineensis]|uniref:LOW QUALITY PROTEIN: mitochondrial import receptor subunit TOM9-2 n=1 Tax=Elaeis guineensis var. tenera TaxID=51953 RepID=UPI003C6D4550
MSSSQGRRGSLPGTSRDGEGLLSRVSSSISQSPIVYRGKVAASEAATVSKKLLWSTGRAAWIAGTTFLVLVVPLIIEMDREQQMNELEMQQASLLGTSSPSMAGPAPPK